MASTFFIPSGTKNLRALFPNVDWDRLEEYHLEVNDATGTLLATTPTTFVQTQCEDDVWRIHFVNNLGGVDAISGKRMASSVEVKGEVINRGAPVPFNSDVHAQLSSVGNEDERFTLCFALKESELQWFRELIETPLCWREWTGIEGEPDSYQPLVITEGKMPLYQEEDNYIYQVNITFTPSQRKVLLRN